MVMAPLREHGKAVFDNSEGASTPEYILISSLELICLDLR